MKTFPIDVIIKKGIQIYDRKVTQPYVQTSGKGLLLWHERCINPVVWLLPLFNIKKTWSIYDLKHKPRHVPS